VRDGKGGRQGHLETRDGIYALGVYYVNLPDGSGQSVRYFVDDWGYHPLVSYTSATKTGTTKAHFALGEKAVAALAKSQETNSLVSNTEYYVDWFFRYDQLSCVSGFKLLNLQHYLTTRKRVLRS